MKNAESTRGKYPRTKEHRDKMSGIKKGYKPTKETREKLSKKIKWMHDNEEWYQKKCKESNHTWNYNTRRRTRNA